MPFHAGGYTLFQEERALKLGAALAVFFLLLSIYMTSKSIDREREEAGISVRRIVAGGRFTGPTILGFADVVADALWLTANEYFWNKEYLKLYPIFRSITWLDPHYVHVYKIGAWHLAYNLQFVIEVSEEKAMEFVREGISFLKEGIENNPRRFDLNFELGWLYFERLANYEEAAVYFRKAMEFEHPLAVEHMLAHSYERMGEKEKAAREWKRIVSENPDDDGAVFNFERIDRLLKSF